jgi:predicted transposase YdaD
LYVIHQLPQTPATLWVRLLGRGNVQARAIQAVAALPAEHPYRNNALDLLGNLKIILEARETIEPEEQELIMQLSPLYLEKLQAAEQIGEQRGEINGRQDFVLRLLKKRVGDVSAEVLSRVMELSLEQLEDLYDVALDFTEMSDLTAWLDVNG